MVEYFQSCSHSGAMPRAPWLLFYLLGILVLLVSVSQAVPENKLSEVNGEEGVIDRLEAYLLARGVQQQPTQHRQQQTPEQQPEQEGLTRQQQVSKSVPIAGPQSPAVATVVEAGQEEKQSLGNAKTLKDSRKIEFGVGPSDPRYFVSSEDESSDVNNENNNNNQPRVNNLQTRSGPTRNNPYYPQPNYRFDATSSDDPQALNNYFHPEGAYSDFDDTELERQRLRYAAQQAAQYGTENAPQYGAEDTARYGTLTRYDLLGPGAVAQYGRNLNVAPSVRANNEAVYVQGYDGRTGFDAGAPDDLTKAIWERIAELRGEGGGEDTREFLRQVAEAVQRGDKDVARRMLGIRATSQPESVHFLHPKQREMASDTPVTSDGLTPAQEQPKEPTKTDYNPNDPSSNINIDTVLPSNKSGAALGGRHLAAGPQHLSQSRHSAELASGSVSATEKNNFSDVYFTAMVAGCTAAAVCAIIGTGVCWYKLNKNHRAAKDAEYPAYGVTGPSRDLSPGSGGSGGDRTLAHSAHMYHYQQQKNQMIAIDKSGAGEGGAGAGGGASDADSEEEDGEDRDYTVYECPGLAPMGEMVVPNPMYPPEDNTPASPSLKEELENSVDRN